MEQFKRYQTGKAKRKPARFDESALQQACVLWFRTQHSDKKRLLFSIPNGATLAGDAKARARQWARLSKEGAMSGAADLFLAIPSGDLAGLFIEIKTPKGVQGKEQKEFERAVLDEGYGYAMPRSVNEFITVITQYLQNGTY